jgi:hypothetical protein
MRSKTVVFPAPLGPISAVIDPSATSKVAPETALTPPYERRSCSIRRSGVAVLTGA